MNKKLKLMKVLSILFVMLCLIVSMFPIYWMLNTSLKGQAEIYSKIPTMIPKKINFDNYIYLYKETPFLGALKNSFLVALCSSIFSIFVAYPASYAVSRVKFRGRNMMTKSILYTYLIPTSVLYIPLFMLVSKMGLTNSIWGLMLIYPTFTLPYVAWMLIPHVSSIPVEIEEAAKVDGCNRLGSMYRIVFPLTLPGIISTFIFAFSMCWGEYLYALVNVSDTAMKTFPLVISGLIYGDIYPWGQIMAGAITACVPILIVYMLASNFLVGGVTSGGVKQ